MKLKIKGQTLNQKQQMWRWQESNFYEEKKEVSAQNASIKFVFQGNQLFPH